MGSGRQSTPLRILQLDILVRLPRGPLFLVSQYHWGRLEHAIICTVAARSCDQDVFASPKSADEAIARRGGMQPRGCHETSSPLITARRRILL